MWQGTLITGAYWLITRNLQSIHAKYWTGMALVVVSLVVPIIHITSGVPAAEQATQVITLTATVVSYQQLSYDGLLQYMINASLPYLVLVWAATVMFLSFRLVRSWIQLAAIEHECEPSISRKFKQYIKDTAIRLDLPTIPVLKISRKVMVPAAYGFFKPTVLLPLSLINHIPQDQLDAIIKHELCHLKRNDFIHNIVQLFADILLFFHPGIRWMNNDIRHIREQCCDQLVLSHDTETLTYAKALTNIAEFSNGIKLSPSVHLGINDGMLLNRVKFLLQNKSSQSSLMVFVPFLLLFLLMLVMLQPANQGDNGFSLSAAETQITLADEATITAPFGRKNFGQQDFYPKFASTEYNSEAEPTATQAPVRTEPAMAVNSSSNANTPAPAVVNNLLTESLIDRQAMMASMKQDIELPVTDDLVTTYDLFDPKEQALSGQPPMAELATSTTEVVADSLNETVPRTSDHSNNLASFTADNSIKPLYKKYVAPNYPQHFWYNQIEQEVIATFKINPNGKVYDIKLNSQINNFVAFEQEVEKAMKRWKFDPKSLNSSTLQRTYQQIFSFAISDDIERNCELKTTGTRLSKPMPCNK
ncbi:M56 family metallopeptidase [Marinicella meishanensis]|uniref:M56 family metallopeptidase n=1 Tax=Marinicella meishanensis TaxID=2873263 RepID=UPI001CBAB025|nr:M56 family metallopeptidase [Marinicella sp. NBU2979]